MNFVYTFSCVITVSLIVHYIILINLSLSFLDINILQIDYILFAQHAESGPTQKCYHFWTSNYTFKAKLSKHHFQHNYLVVAGEGCSMAIVVTDCQAQHEPLGESVNIPHWMLDPKSGTYLIQKWHSDHLMSMNIQIWQSYVLPEKLHWPSWREKTVADRNNGIMHRAEFVTLGYQFFYVTVIPHLGQESAYNLGC